MHLAVNASAKILRDPAALRVFFAQAIIDITAYCPDGYAIIAWTIIGRNVGYVG